MIKTLFLTILFLTFATNTNGQLEINGYPLNYYSDHELRSMHLDSNTHFSITDTSRYAKFYMNLINNKVKRDLLDRPSQSVFYFLTWLEPNDNSFLFLLDYMDHLDFKPFRNQKEAVLDTGESYRKWPKYSEFKRLSNTQYRPKKMKTYLKGFTLINPGLNTVFNTKYKNHKKSKILTYYDWESKVPFSEKDGRLKFNTENICVNDLLYSCDTSIFKNKDNLDQVSLNQLLPPFYFKNTEVTNNEYRVFVEWVRDSMAWSRLNEIDSIAFTKKPNRINYSDSNIQKLLPEFYEYHMRTTDSIAGLNNGILTYKFNGKPIKIYPDTLRWLRDFSYSFIEPMARHYSHHATYDEYPVVGISWEMANAYLNWLNQRLKELQEPGDTLYLMAKLPTITQWKQANSLMDKPQKKIYTVDWYAFSIPSEKYNDFNTFLNLDLFLPDPNKYLYNSPIFHDFTNRNQALNGNYTALDGSFNTSTTNKKRDYFKYSLNYNKTNSISHTAGNVSEWLDHGIENWMQHYELFKIMLRNNYNSEDKSIFLSIADYQDNIILKNIRKGKLIMGANWFDERHSTINGKPISGYYAKTFKNQDYTSPTVGFRYVLLVKKK